MNYYSGQEVAPLPTVFIGGNHEASNYLWELYYGGWTMPNIYFMGFAGVIKFGTLCIGGLSGSYNACHYHLGHYKKPPYNENDTRSIYHLHEYDVYKLKQVEEPIGIFLSHDWPVGIDYAATGSFQEKDSRKHMIDYAATGSFHMIGLSHDWPVKKEIQENTLGSKAAANLLEKLNPPYWFSAHLHCTFVASVGHGESGSVTEFLALYDEEWLAITRKFNHIFPLTRYITWLGRVQLDRQDLEMIKSNMATRGPNPFDFVQTVPPYNPNHLMSRGSFSVQSRNPQTVSL
ncbi:hypothetical protein MKW92_009656 [Papaver armeniacum]|nr:hypothetical protein MKW92_009656 [Papaver armeniacum]